MNLGLRGRSALVTGGSRGIGRSTVELLAAEGANVATCSRGGVEDTLDAIRGHGVTSYGEAVDVLNEPDLEEFIDRAATALAGLDIVVSNVSAPLSSQGAGRWRDSFEIDLLQHVRLVEAALPYLRRGHDPAIVFMSSVASVMRELPDADREYGAIKAALVSYCGQLAEQLAADRIRVNVVSPGPVVFEGGVWEGVRQDDPQTFQAVASSSALGRMADPAEIARVVVFVCSPAASYLTGANLRVDGGFVKTVQS
jgi:3-oxoacyl-[acyl-carrier protein] reductase